MARRLAAFVVTGWWGGKGVGGVKDALRGIYKLLA